MFIILNSHSKGYHNNYNNTLECNHNKECRWVCKILHQVIVNLVNRVKLAKIKDTRFRIIKIVRTNHKIFNPESLMYNRIQEITKLLILQIHLCN